MSVALDDRPDGLEEHCSLIVSFLNIIPYTSHRFRFTLHIMICTLCRMSCTLSFESLSYKF